jgi:hypothetical protein
VQAVVHADPGAGGVARAFFTFHQSTSDPQRIFHVKLKLQDWILGAGKTVTDQQSQPCFLYFLNGGVQLHPARFQKMETLLRERDARIR